MPRGTGNIRRTLALWFSTLTLLALVPISEPSENTTDRTTPLAEIDSTTTSLPEPSTTSTPDSTTSTPEPTTPAAACPAGWKEYGDHCYNITIEPKLSWEDAQRACQLTPGGDLLVLNNTAEHNFITQEVSCPKIEAPSPYLNLWIGLHRDCSGDSQIFTWISGVEFDQVFGVWWEIGQPDNFHNTECCADVLAGYCKQSGIFRDEKCGLEQGYICEVPKDPPTEVPKPSPGRPQETSSVMAVQTSSAVPYMTSTVELYSTVDAITSLPQPTPSPSVPIEFTPLPSNTPAGLTTPMPVMCRGEILDGLQWAETEGGTAANQQCPLNPFAIVTRACLLVSMTSAIWRPPDYSDCEVPSAGELLDRLTFMSHFSTVNPDDVIKATFQLSQMAAPLTAEGRSNSAQTYSVLVELLEKVAALPSKFTECRQEDMEKFANSFLQAVDNILHPDNIALWSSSQQVSADSIRIMDAVESFTAQTATDTCDLTLASHQDMPAFFEGKYDHIVFRKSQEASEAFSGLTYRAGTPSATITLPQGVFSDVTDKQVTQLIAMYPTIGQLLDSIPPQTLPSSDSSMQVISSIVTSSAVHQSATAFQTLSVPLCINFTKKTPTYEKEESCVYLGRSDSGDNQWLTDGCWMNEHRNGSVHCCCNHMTSFAVLSATETTVPYQLHLLTYVLCSAACFIILLSALILFSVRHLNTAVLTVHASLALSVILGFVVIMIGLERTSNQVVCQVLAVATHYILTSQFVWSLEGALQLCFMANSERQEQRVFQLWIYHVIGWGGPVLPVGICAALWLHEYGGAQRCWVGDNILVGFISSLGALVLINAMLLVYLSSKSVPIGTTMQNSSEGNSTTKKRTMDGLRSNTLMLAMLCLCWGFGIAAFQLKSDVLQQAFAVTALLLGVCFFMMHLIMSHEVRSAILHRRKKSHSKNHTKIKLRQRRLSDSLMTTNSVPYPTTGVDGTGADPTGAHHQLVPVQHLDRTDQSLGSTSTSLSQFNTRSTGTNCTDIACDPIHEESYELYRRADNSPAADHGNLGFDQQMLPWTNGRMIQPGPGSLGERSPRLPRVRDRESSERRHRTDLSPVKRNGNIVLNHKIIREPEQGSSLDEESRDKKRRRKHHVSSVSGSTPSMNMACMPFPMDHHVSRGSRVHPMPIDPLPYGLDFPGSTLMQPQMIYPRIAGFLAQPHRALPLPSPSFSRAPIHQLPMISTDLGGIHRSLDYHGNQRRARDDLYEGPRMVMETGYQGQLYGYNGSRAFDDGFHRSRAMDDIAGPSGYKPRSSRSVDSQRRRRNSEGDSYRDSKGSKGKGQNVKGHKSGSKSRGGRKSKQKTKAASEDI